GCSLGLSLGLLCRDRLGPLAGTAPAGRVLRNAGRVEETRHPVARLGTDAQPVAQALLPQPPARRVVAGQDRIVDAQLLQEFAVPRLARVRRDDPVDRSLLRAGTGQAN